MVTLLLASKSLIFFFADFVIIEKSKQKFETLYLSGPFSDICNLLRRLQWSRYFKVFTSWSLTGVRRLPNHRPLAVDRHPKWRHCQPSKRPSQLKRSNSKVSARHCIGSVYCGSCCWFLALDGILMEGSVLICSPENVCL